MVSTRRTASSLSAQAAGNNNADDGTTGAESRLTPTPAEKTGKTTSTPKAAAAKSTKSNAAAAAAPAAPSSSPPSRRRAAAALQPVPEEERTGEARLAKHPSSPLRKSAQGKKQASAKATGKKADAKAKAAASAGDGSSSEDEDDAGDDGLACLAQGMLDALCGMTGGQKLEGAGGSESESDDDDADWPPPAPPATPTSVAAADDGGAAPSSSDSDSDSEGGSDDDEDRAAAAPVNVSWAPTSLHLPRPASATPAIELLARRARGAEELETSLPGCRLALPRLSRKKGGEDAVTAASAPGPPPRRRPSSSSSSWFDLPSQTLTPELKTDLRLLRLRGAMDPTRHYKSADTTKLPGRFHVGTVVEASTDFYSSRLHKSERGQTLTHELLRDRALSAQRKRRFGALQDAAAARGKRGGGGKGAKVRKTSLPRLTKHRVRPKH